MKRLAFVIILFAFALSSSVAQPDLNAQINELARQLNLWRINDGLGPLVYNESLERMAANQADYLLSQPQLPSDLHLGPSGLYPRQRSQDPQYGWPVYGNPLRMSVTEIAAVGNIDSAIAFWRGSELHNRSVSNIAYREVGIAARPFGTDILFIVVLGSRPDVLPVLVDAEANDMYLTTELIRFEGDWIGNATEYRFLDAEEQPLNEWAAWQRVLFFGDLPFADEIVYIQYRDQADHYTRHAINYTPQWSSIPAPESALEQAGTPIPPTASPTAIGAATATDAPPLAFATNTPAPITPTPAPTLTPFPTFTPTLTPIPDSVQLLYNANTFTLYNVGPDPVDLTDVRFRRDDVGFVATFWEEVSDILNLAALPATHCLMIQPEDGTTYTPPSQCSLVRSIVLEPNPRYFWLGTFEIYLDDDLLQTCAGDSDSCTLLLPG